MTGNIEKEGGKSKMKKKNQETRIKKQKKVIGSLSHWVFDSMTLRLYDILHDWMVTWVH
jgi:hypothetical protein